VRGGLFSFSGRTQGALFSASYSPAIHVPCGRGAGKNFRKAFRANRHRKNDAGENRMENRHGDNGRIRTICRGREKMLSPYRRRRGQPVISDYPEILDAGLRFVMVRLHGSYPEAVRFPVHGGSGDGAMLREANHSQRACGWAAGSMDVRIDACVEWRGGVDASVMAVMCVCGGWPMRIHPFRFSAR
jgi:hypothetical protein